MCARGAWRLPRECGAHDNRKQHQYLHACVCISRPRVADSAATIAVTLQRSVADELPRSNEERAMAMLVVVASNPTGCPRIAPAPRRELTARRSRRTATVEQCAYASRSARFATTGSWRKPRGEPAGTPSGRRPRSRTARSRPARAMRRTRRIGGSCSWPCRFQGRDCSGRRGA